MSHAGSSTVGEAGSTPQSQLTLSIYTSACYEPSIPYHWRLTRSVPHQPSESHISGFQYRCYARCSSSRR